MDEKILHVGQWVFKEGVGYGKVTNFDTFWIYIDFNHVGMHLYELPDETITIATIDEWFLDAFNN